MTPLAGRTILVTRSREQAGELREVLESLGARVIEAPVIAFEDPEDWGPVDAAIQDLARYDFILFTSANAVDRFFKRLRGRGTSVAGPGHASLVAIGSGTAARLEALGARVDLVAAQSRAEGVLELLVSSGPLDGRRILIPRAAVARDLLPERLRAEQASVDVVVVYRTVAVPPPPEVIEMLRAGAIDAVTFTSSSTVINLIAGIQGVAALSGVAVAVIGPVTQETARQAGLEPSIIAASAGMPAMAEAIAAYFARS